MPVTADGFFDRETELSALEEVASRLEKGAPRWLAILGVRKIGKSSLVAELARRSRKPELAVLLLAWLEGDGR